MATVSQARLTMAVMGGSLSSGGSITIALAASLVSQMYKHKREGGAFINCHSSLELKKRKRNYII